MKCGGMKVRMGNKQNQNGHDNSQRKKLGVIGGIGPAATAYFYELLTRMPNVGTDQEHPEIFIISRPSIPDRTAYILDKGAESPIPLIIATGCELVRLGADIIAIPCVTSHSFFDELSRGIGVPLINMIRETAGYLEVSGVKCAGLMATDGTIASGMFSREMEERGIHAVVLSERSQAVVMSLIYDDVKANKPVDFGRFTSAADELRANGAETVVLGCTELSLIKRDFGLLVGYVDALEVLARRSLELCGIGCA